MGGLEINSQALTRHIQSLLNPFSTAPPSYWNSQLFPHSLGWDIQIAGGNWKNPAVQKSPSCESQEREHIICLRQRSLDLILNPNPYSKTFLIDSHAPFLWIAMSLASVISLEPHWDISPSQFFLKGTCHIQASQASPFLMHGSVLQKGRARQAQLMGEVSVLEATECCTSTVGSGHDRSLSSVPTWQCMYIHPAHPTSQTMAAPSSSLACPLLLPAIAAISAFSPACWWHAAPEARRRPWKGHLVRASKRHSDLIGELLLGGIRVAKSRGRQALERGWA